jgi:O-antigen/teichoic acid export membrane protein
MAVSLFFVKELVKLKDNYVFMKLLIKISLKLAIIFYLVYLFLSPFFAYFLHIDNYLIVILTGITLFFSFFGLYQRVFFQAK